MIRVGIGGWTFAPWRGTFYPPGLPHAQELRHASSRLSAIEINGTFYRTQTPASFRKWAEETPGGFVFAVKASRYAAQRPRLGEAREAVEHFLGSGVLELGDKLGPILWQLAPTKAFDPAEMAAFFALLPPEREGRPLRHAIEVRHASFVDPAFIELARRAGVAVALIDSEKHPLIPDATAGFVYARLQRTEEREREGYPPAMIDLWAERFRAYARGGTPADLAPIAPVSPSPGTSDCFVFMISGAKERAPAAALALADRLDALAANARPSAFLTPGRTAPYIAASGPGSARPSAATPRGPSGAE